MSNQSKILKSVVKKNVDKSCEYSCNTTSDNTYTEAPYKVETEQTRQPEVSEYSYTPTVVEQIQTPVEAEAPAKVKEKKNSMPEYDIPKL